MSVLKDSDPRRLDPLRSAATLHRRAAGSGRCQGSVDFRGGRRPLHAAERGDAELHARARRRTRRWTSSTRATACPPQDSPDRAILIPGSGWGSSLPRTAPGWDTYCRRINSIVRHEEKYIAFYDGSASHLENYEEKTGLAVSSDLRSWETLTAGGPALTSEHATGSLRYLDAVTTDDGIWAFYECARADGAHDLRVARMEVDQLARRFSLAIQRPEDFSMTIGTLQVETTGIEGTAEVRPGRVSARPRMPGADDTRRARPRGSRRTGVSSAIEPPFTARSCSAGFRSRPRRTSTVSSRRSTCRIFRMKTRCRTPCG